MHGYRTGVSGTLAPLIGVIKELMLIQNTCFLVPKESNKACYKDLIRK